MTDFRIRALHASIWPPTRWEIAIAYLIALLVGMGIAL